MNGIGHFPPVLQHHHQNEHSFHNSHNQMHHRVQLPHHQQPQQLQQPFQLDQSQQLQRRHSQPMPHFQSSNQHSPENQHERQAQNRMMGQQPEQPTLHHHQQPHQLQQNQRRHSQPLQHFQHPGQPESHILVRQNHHQQHQQPNKLENGMQLQQSLKPNQHEQHQKPHKEQQKHHQQHQNVGSSVQLQSNELPDLHQETNQPLQQQQSQQRQPPTLQQLPDPPQLSVQPRQDPQTHQLQHFPHPVQPPRTPQLNHHQPLPPPFSVSQNGNRHSRLGNNNQQYPWNYTNHGNTVAFNNTRMTHGLNPSTYHPGHLDEEMMMDEQDYAQYQLGYGPEDDEILEGMMTPRAVHQCNVCNKIFVSYKGLQQHAVIHTDQKPFRCDICAKSFRFKSNLFEHRSVHSGFTPHACPYCGKTCRLKGNLKKHLRTHVTTKEELEAAWRPFASNRRPPADIPEDAIVVRGTGGPYYHTTPPKVKKRRLGLGEPGLWVDKLRNGDLLPQVELEDKIRRLEDTIFNNITLERWSSLFEMAKAIAFETHDCPVCKMEFMTRSDCITHHTIAHTSQATEFFCEKCFRQFADENSYNQHASYHTRVVQMIESGIIVPDPCDPDILVPTNDEFQMLFDGSMPQNILEPSIM